jgi:hypothetical protein
VNWITNHLIDPPDPRRIVSKDFPSFAEETRNQDNPSLHGAVPTPEFFEKQGFQIPR